MNLNEKLEILLSRKRIKKSDFAQSVGITYRAFAYYMSGTRSPRKSVLEKIAKELNVSSEFLSNDSIDIDLTAEEKFIKNIASKGGDTAGATKFLSQSRGLFAGNSLSEDDKTALMRCLSEIYEDSKSKNYNNR